MSVPAKAQPGRRDPQQALVGLYQVIGIEQGVEHTDSGIFVGNLLCLVGNIGAFVVTQRDKEDIVIGTVVGRFRFVVRLAAQQLDPDGVGPVGADQLKVFSSRRRKPVVYSNVLFASARPLTLS